MGRFLIHPTPNPSPKGAGSFAGRHPIPERRPIPERHPIPGRRPIPERHLAYFMHLPFSCKICSKLPKTYIFLSISQILR